MTRIFNIIISAVFIFGLSFLNRYYMAKMMIYSNQDVARKKLYFGIGIAAILINIVIIGLNLSRILIWILK